MAHVILPPTPPHSDDEQSIHDYNVQLHIWFRLITDHMNRNHDKLDALQIQVDTEHP